LGPCSQAGKGAAEQARETIMPPAVAIWPCSHVPSGPVACERRVRSHCRLLQSFSPSRYAAYRISDRLNPFAEVGRLTTSQTLPRHHLLLATYRRPSGSPATRAARGEGGGGASSSVSLWSLEVGAAASRLWCFDRGRGAQFCGGAISGRVWTMAAALAGACLQL
jgi:hypothetical protein